MVKKEMKPRVRIQEMLMGHGWVCVQDMLISHVSGGFWLQVPQPLVATVGFTDKRAILLRNVYDTSSRPPDTTYCENVARLEWACVWLPRAGAGAGLSGGWRGFSIDHVRSSHVSLKSLVVQPFLTLCV